MAIPICLLMDHGPPRHALSNAPPSRTRRCPTLGPAYVPRPHPTLPVPPRVAGWAGWMLGPVHGRSASTVRAVCKATSVRCVPHPSPAATPQPGIGHLSICCCRVWLSVSTIISTLLSTRIRSFAKICRNTGRMGTRGVGELPQVTSSPPWGREGGPWGRRQQYCRPVRSADFDVGAGRVTSTTDARGGTTTEAGSHGWPCTLSLRIDPRAAVPAIRQSPRVCDSEGRIATSRPPSCCSAGGRPRTQAPRRGEAFVSERQSRAALRPPRGPRGNDRQKDRTRASRSRGRPLLSFPDSLVNVAKQCHGLDGMRRGSRLSRPTHFRAGDVRETLPPPLSPRFGTGGHGPVEDQAAWPQSVHLRGQG